MAKITHNIDPWDKASQAMAADLAGLPGPKLNKPKKKKYKVGSQKIKPLG
jgi:hypothetical protein